MADIAGGGGSVIGTTIYSGTLPEANVLYMQPVVYQMQYNTHCTTDKKNIECK